MPISADQAIRTADFDLWIISLKKSLKLFEITGKHNYWWLVTRHLFDVTHRFSEFHLQVYKQCWVTRCSTTNTNVGLDEKNEFVNKFLKGHMRSLSLEKLDFLAKNYNFLEELVEVGEEMYQTRNEKENRKSTNVDYENLSLIDQEGINIKIPLPLLQIYGSFVDFEKIRAESAKIIEDYGWDLDIEALEDVYYPDN